MLIMIKLVAAVLVAGLGVSFSIYGGHDDSPGAVLIGMVVTLAAVAFGVRVVLRARRAEASHRS